MYANDASADIHDRTLVGTIVWPAGGVPCGKCEILSYYNVTDPHKKQMLIVSVLSRFKLLNVPPARRRSGLGF